MNISISYLKPQFSCSDMSNSSQLHGLQHTRLPCPSPTAKAYSNSSPSSWWCHPTISPSAVPLSSGLQSFPASGSFPMSQFFASGGQSISFSISPSNEYSGLISFMIDWFDLLAAKGLSRVFSSTTVKKHKFFSTQPPSFLLLLLLLLLEEGEGGINFHSFKSED